MERILTGEESEVRVGRGFPQPIFPGEWDGRTVAVFTQDPVIEIATQVVEGIEAMGARALIHRLPDRDEAKTLASVGAAYEWMASIDLHRDDAVIGVGGGAVTDTAGFLAATWMRGVASFYVPTTLLGAVDAAVGGKTGLNVGGKNLVGAFWMPRSVVVDLDVLEELDTDLLREGSAEVLKVGLLADADIVAAYRADGLGAPLDPLVPKAIRIKAQIVSGDFTEQGKRALLNLGHTVGHAVEYAARIPHGHAVAIGLVAAAAVSEHKLGFAHASLVEETLVRLGLPTRAPSAIDRDRLNELIRLDKKRVDGEVTMVLLEDVAVPSHQPVTDEDLDVGLSAIGL